jgi:thymidylate synthase ThyX
MTDIPDDLKSLLPLTGKVNSLKNDLKTSEKKSKEMKELLEKIVKQNEEILKILKRQIK